MRHPFWLLGLLGLLARLTAAQPCRLEIIDQDGWPVPGVELRTVHHVRLVSDNAGVIACDLPELMGRETWFEVIGHGYSVKKDGFGFFGVRLTPTPGGRLRVPVERTIVARRLGRLTGAGRFAESQKFGDYLDAPESGVLGCDSVVPVSFQGKQYWFWGDTNLPPYPLGIFNVSAATTEGFTPPARPPLNVTYKYITSTKNGIARPRGVAPLPGPGPAWVWGLTVLPDRTGREHLVGAIVKIRGTLEAYRWDLVEWDEATQNFRALRTLWTKDAAHPTPPATPDGQAVPWTDAAGKAWVLFGGASPKLRIPATYEAWQDPQTWEELTAATTARTPEGKIIQVHGGHLAWHPWSQKWLSLFTEKGGAASFLGEIWLATSDSPFGPWGQARQVLSHDNYTFYNPILHPEFFRADSPIIHFEGTYTTTFSANKQPTPRWDYNQVLYQLDLSAPPFAAKK